MDVEGSTAETEEIVDDVINEETIEKFAKKTNRHGDHIIEENRVF